MWGFSLPTINEKITTRNSMHQNTPLNTIYNTRDKLKKVTTFSVLFCLCLPITWVCFEERTRNVDLMWNLYINVFGNVICCVSVYVYDSVTMISSYEKTKWRRVNVNDILNFKCESKTTISFGALHPPQNHCDKGHIAKQKNLFGRVACPNVYMNIAIE